MPRQPILVIRQNIEPFTVVRQAVPFDDGQTDFITGVRYTCSCECVFEFGVRMDKPATETAMVAFACDEHRPTWDETLRLFMADKRETTEALTAALTATRGGGAE